MGQIDDKEKQETRRATDEVREKPYRSMAEIRRAFYPKAECEQRTGPRSRQAQNNALGLSSGNAG